MRWASKSAGAKFGRRDLRIIAFATRRILQGIGCIPSNPVMGKLVGRAAEYRYCSAFPGFRLDAWPPAAKAVERVEV